MPSAPHEMLHHIFREDTGLFSRTLRLLEIPFPEHDAVAVGNIDTTEVQVLERRLDTLLEAQTADGPFLVAIEAQGRPDARKLRNWAYYPAYLHERHACPVVVIVVCRDVGTAVWARKPYCIGLPENPTLTSTPIVLGPDNLPKITDVQQVIADPNAAALSAIAHGKDPDVAAILETILAALTILEDRKTAISVGDFITRGLEGTPAHEIWRNMMVIPTRLRLRSEFAMEGRAQGLAEGKAEGKVEGLAEGKATTLLTILDQRKVPLSQAVRDRIAGCTDLSVLDAWIAQALTVQDADELFMPCTKN